MSGNNQKPKLKLWTPSIEPGVQSFSFGRVKICPSNLGIPI
ncbi:hypothetical protein BGP_0469 [Beggiatoa sp. PS]|nr:hypothetical protein BGP_0469 [Beggiatoa sp. PS]